MIELSSSKIKAFNLTLYNGEAVVRNQNRINGLIGVRGASIPSQYHGLLAKAEFIGSVVNETIIWKTDVFRTEPTRLSELSPSDRSRYKQILNDALVAYASAISSADKNVRDLLYAAITYPSDQAVFCADSRVVITEWGMKPLGDPGIIGMPYSIDDLDKPGFKGHPDQDNSDRTDVDERTDDSVISDGNDTDPKDTHMEDAGGEGPHNGGEETDKPDGDKIVPPGPPVPPVSPEKPKKKKEWWKRWWAWLLGLLLLLLLILLLSALFSGCSGSKPIEDTAPDLSNDDVVLSDDSTRYVARNRVIILLSAQNADVNGFAKEFRKKYTDADKYKLSNPDTTVKRVTLTLPPEERAEISEKLPTQFPDYGLIVIPETIYTSDAVTNDPAMQDKDKRWYFDECSVFDAWDETMGDKDVVVAVIDDGFDLNHPELKGKIVKPFNAVNHTSNITPSASGHGTHVAATSIGNANNSAGLSGIAPNCKLMPIQVADANGRMSSTAIFDAVMYAIQNGADVVNMSLGMYFGPMMQYLPLYMQKNIRANLFLEEQRVWDQIFEIARQRNVTFVLAGGNENILIGVDPMDRNPNTIRVSATQPNRYKADFSNYGDMSTVSAPGVHIFNAVPGSKYTFMDGTSMASPVVAGGCALLKSKYKGISTAELIDLLRRTGNPSGSDVGPIVNFARALSAGAGGSVPGTDDECMEASRRYQELVEELEKLKREHPGCVQAPDTLALPVNFSPKDLMGRWKSTTSLYNEQDQEVVLYFTFNGTPRGRLDIIEPSGATYSAGLNVAVSSNVVNIDQLSPATGSSGKSYNPYRFVLKPGVNRKAEGNAKNKVQSANIFNFNLIRI